MKETRKSSGARRDIARQPHRESIHEQGKYHCKKQRRSQSCVVQHRWQRDAQCVKNGWWLSQKDRAGEPLAWNAHETQGRRPENGSTKARAREKSKILELKKRTLPVGMIGDETSSAYSSALVS